VRAAAYPKRALPLGLGAQRFTVGWRAIPNFAHALDMARTRMIAAAERTLQHAIEHGDTRAAMWLLERLAPEYRPVRPVQPLTHEAENYRVELEVVDAPEVRFEELLQRVAHSD
jgi:hypothetical protein